MPDLLKEASLLLSREAARLPHYPSQSRSTVPPGPQNAGSRSRAATAEATSDGDTISLQQQLGSLIDTLLRLVPQLAPALQRGGGVFTGDPLVVPRPGGAAVSRLAARNQDASCPVSSLRCSPVPAGQTAHFALSVVNQGNVPCPLALCSTALIAGTGFEISGVNVAASPRLVELAPHATAEFDVAIHVPAQAAPGKYAGLIRALGSSDFQAVLLLDVL